MLRNLRRVEVTSDGHLRFQSIDCDLHPRVVLRVELSDVVKRSIGERVPAEDPQESAPIHTDGVSEPRQRLLQMVQFVGDDLRVEELGHNDRRWFDGLRAVVTTKTVVAVAPIVGRVALALVQAGAAVVRTNEDVAVQPAEPRWTNAVVALVADVRIEARPELAAEHGDDGVESFVLPAPSEVDRHLSRPRFLDDPREVRVVTDDARQLLLHQNLRVLGDAVVDVNRVVVARNVHRLLIDLQVDQRPVGNRLVQLQDPQAFAGSVGRLM